MKKKRFGILTFFCTITFLFAFSCGVLATQAEDFADEEGDDDGGSFSASTLTTQSITTSTATDGNLIIVLDPGHGGSESGTYSVNSNVYERECNLVVAQACKAYLENYSSKVTVILTRSDNKTGESLNQRAVIAANYGADLMISLHFNGNKSSSARGCEAYVSRLDEYALSGLATQILSNLNSQIGVPIRANGGVYTRASETKPPTVWRDGVRTADYYGIIKHPAEYDIPSMIIEHCFLTNSSDYNYASSNAKLNAIGVSDAKAIISYFNLDENISSTTLENAKYNGKSELTNYYNSLDLNSYSAAYQLKINHIYQDGLNRIDLATGTGKITLTLKRVKTMIANYPKYGVGSTGFEDVAYADWFCDDVMYCVKNNMFNGTSDWTFDPGNTISRGMFVAVLGRYAGVDGTIPASTKFSDVSSSAYYAPYVAWASTNSIVEGINDTTYGPNESITREDLVTLIYRYVTTENITLSGSTGKTISSFKDGSNVDGYAQDAMNWAVGCGIINGNDLGNLNPRGYTTRAEAAKIMMVFKQNSN